MYHTLTRAQMFIGYLIKPLYLFDHPNDPNHGSYSDELILDPKFVYYPLDSQEWQYDLINFRKLDHNSLLQKWRQSRARDWAHKDKNLDWEEIEEIRPVLEKLFDNIPHFDQKVKILNPDLYHNRADLSKRYAKMPVFLKGLGVHQGSLLEVLNQS